MLCHFHSSDTYHLPSVVHEKRFNYGCLLKRFPLPMIFRKYIVQTLKNTVNLLKKNLSKLSKLINVDVIFVNSFGQSISHTTTVGHCTILIIVTKKRDWEIPTQTALTLLQILTCDDSQPRKEKSLTLFWPFIHFQNS